MTEQFSSKRNIFLTGLILLVVGGIFGGMGTLSIFKVINDLKHGVPLTKTLFIVPLIFYPFLFYTFYYLLTYFPSLIINKHGIELSTIIKTKKYSWTEIQQIQITGKQLHKFLFMSMPVEATTIKLNDNSEIHLWVDYYRNKSDLRVVLDRANNILQNNKQFERLDFKIGKPNFADQNVNNNDAKVFNGNHLFTFNGLFFYGWVIFIGFMISTKPNVFLTNYSALISISFATLVITGMLSYQMNYFQVTNQYLIVKNTIWVWRKDIYLLADIREVVIETPHKLSTSLRVITNDYRDKLYPACSLNEKTWKELMNNIQSYKIKVRNEAI